MKKSRFFLTTALLALSLPVSANLFFSEYIEGSGNNKALEIYNGGDSPVDLSRYEIRFYFNGSINAGTTLVLAGSLQPGGVHVIADSDAVGSILDVADQIFTGSFFNGDDAIELIFEGATDDPADDIVVDSIGQRGFDPGSQWGAGLTSTQNNTLRRKDTVMTGDADSTDAFDPALEWVGYAQDNFANLGAYAPGEPPVPLFAMIHEIQGAGFSSPLQGENVVVEAIVVGDFQDNGGSDNGDLSGFYLQEEDAEADANPLTSDAVFVADGAGLVDVAVGDRVRVTGRVGEGFGQTQISAMEVEVLSAGLPLPAPAELTLPLNEVRDLEAYEGMYVRFPQSLVISEYFEFARFGSIVLALPVAGEERPMTPTAVVEPGTPANDRAGLNARSRIIYDDGRATQNPETLIHPNGLRFDRVNRFRGGDIVQGAAGILNYSFGEYRLHPTRAANHVVTNPRPELPPYIDAGVRVASFNVLNYFTTLDGSGNICGPANALGCRGADDAIEFQRQRDKIIAAIAAIDADVVGLIEIENQAADAAVDDLVDGLNLAVGADTYSKIDTGTIGTDAIKAAFIYQPARVLPSGPFAILDGSVDPRFVDDRNRPALAQTFMSLRSAGRATVALNHFKSKGSNCNSLGDADAGDGQGNCNLTRRLAAEALADWLADDPTGSGDADFLIIGDLNAYDKEDPIDALSAAGYTDLEFRDGGELAYSYGFDGQFGYLDYALANEALEPQAVAAATWHINADEPNVFDYNTDFKGPEQAALYAADAFRSSDHDPVIVGLDLSASIGDINRFIRHAIDTGSLEGRGGPRRAQRRLRLFVWLVARAEQVAGRRGRVSCYLLGAAEYFSDGKPRPYDLVRGESAGLVASMIGEYRARNCH